VKELQEISRKDAHKKSWQMDIDVCS
jgi:hypothetical protein